MTGTGSVTVVKVKPGALSLPRGGGAVGGGALSGRGGVVAGRTPGRTGVRDDFDINNVVGRGLHSSTFRLNVSAFCVTVHFSAQRKRVLCNRGCI